MITLNGAYRKEFHENVKIYCCENHISINNTIDIGNCYMYSITMETKKADNFIKFIEQLELVRKRYRKLKGFWWRIFN